MRLRYLVHVTQLVFLQLALISSAAIAKVTIENDSNTTVTKVHVEGVTLAKTTLESSSFATLKLKGIEGFEAIDYQIGKPQIPVLRFFVDGLPTVSFSDAGSPKSIISGLKVLPNQPSRVKKPNEKVAVVFDAAFYREKSAKYFPYTIVPAGSINGTVRYLVTLYPVRYEPTSDSYSLISNFEIKAEKNVKVATGEETFAFVVGQQYKDNVALLEYAALKEQLGYKVELIDVTSQDSSDTIREQIQALYRRPGTILKHVLIIGDLQDVPSHQSSIITGVTDHYYRAIDTADYISDINGPDIGVGRVSVADTAQLETVLAKFTRYTHGQFSSEQWLNSISFIATNDQFEIAEGSHNYAIQAYTSPAQYSGVFPAPVMAGGDQLYAITHSVAYEKVLEVLGLGRTIINYSGHGSTTFWAGPYVSQSDVLSLSDPNALPFVISNACITGDFRHPESFAETWQRHGTGAITFWGSMDNTYWDEDDILERAMFDGIYRNRLLSFRDITSHALSEMWRFYGGEGKSDYYWETYVTFGDPSLELRVKAARDLELSGPSVLPIGADTVSYRATVEGNPQAGVRVALSIPGKSAFYSAISNADGVAEIDIADASHEAVSFTVASYGQNTKLSLRELNIIPVDPR